MHGFLCASVPVVWVGGGHSQPIEEPLQLRVFSTKLHQPPANAPVLEKTTTTTATAATTTYDQSTTTLTTITLHNALQRSAAILSGVSA
eukprot:1460879-Amphidinium_carterae.1